MVYTVYIALTKKENREKRETPVLREIKIGGLFMPLIQSLADSAGHVPIVSGYKSSWN